MASVATETAATETLETALNAVSDDTLLAFDDDSSPRGDGDNDEGGPDDLDDGFVDPFAGPNARKMPAPDTKEYRRMMNNRQSARRSYERRRDRTMRLEKENSLLRAELEKAVNLAAVVAHLNRHGPDTPLGPYFVESLSRSRREIPASWRSKRAKPAKAAKAIAKAAKSQAAKASATARRTPDAEEAAAAASSASSVATEWSALGESLPGWGHQAEPLGYYPPSVYQTSPAARSPAITPPSDAPGSLNLMMPPTAMSRPAHASSCLMQVKSEPNAATTPAPRPRAVPQMLGSHAGIVDWTMAGPWRAADSSSMITNPMLAGSTAGPCTRPASNKRPHNNGAAVFSAAAAKRPRAGKATTPPRPTTSGGSLEIGHLGHSEHSANRSASMLPARLKVCSELPSCSLAGRNSLSRGGRGGRAGRAGRGDSSDDGCIRLSLAEPEIHRPPPEPDRSPPFGPVASGYGGTRRRTPASVKAAEAAVMGMYPHLMSMSDNLIAESFNIGDGMFGNRQKPAGAGGKSDTETAAEKVLDDSSMDGFWENEFGDESFCLGVPVFN